MKLLCHHVAKKKGCSVGFDFRYLALYPPPFPRLISLYWLHLISLALPASLHLSSPSLQSISAPFRRCRYLQNNENVICCIYFPTPKQPKPSQHPRINAVCGGLRWVVNLCDSRTCVGKKITPAGNLHVLFIKRLE